jgi:phenylacetate-CoA ligase
MSAQLTAAADAWQPLSPIHPSADPEHEPRTAAAVERAFRDIPFYRTRGDRFSLDASDPASLSAGLARVPLLFKKDVRRALPRQWVPDGRDTRAELAAGTLELVETSGSTGERLRVLWDAGWWMRQERRAMRTHPLVADAMDGSRGEYREAILTSPACGVGTCHVGNLPYEERVLDELLFLNQRPDPLFWTAEEQTRMLEELTRHGAVGLESDPLYLALLSRFAQAQGRTIDVRGFVQLTYAFTTQAYLRAIRAAFAGEVLQLYGASEIGVLFMQGDDGLLHHCPFTTHVELLPVQAPTPGARDVALVVATSLDRVAMPLVRFVLGDLVQVETVASRRWTSVAPLRSVEGRVDDAVVRPDGALVTAGAIDRALAPLRDLRLWQVNQPSANRVEVDVVAEGADGPVLDGVRGQLAPLFEGQEVAVRAATAIPIEPSGKFRVSKRHFPIDYGRFFAASEGRGP